MKKSYYFDKNNYNANGFDIRNYDDTFIDYIFLCEQNFHEEFKPLYANALYAHSNTFFLLKSCFDDSDNEYYGMENIGSDYLDDIIEANVELDEFSQKFTIHALGSQIKGMEDNLVNLIKDDELSEKELVLMYIPDSDDGDEDIPVGSPVKQLEIFK